ncbi:MAG: ATP-dependent helicase [Rhodocyclaceae bacterium]
MHEFIATPEQKAIIEAELKPIAVVACPGSGKTATAVRRVAEIRRRLENDNDRGHVALLSYSNVAVDTFRSEYRLLRGRDDGSDRVIIQTVDAFITSFLLRPHGSRVMGCTRTPFLVLGDEPFLANYRFGKDNQKTFGLEDLTLDRSKGKTVFHRRLKNGATVELDAELEELARKKVKELAKVGGYTYSIGRAWALALLNKEPRLRDALARRFPQILIDEAQDIGSFESAVLDLLHSAGSTISLVGDFHQSIYGFNFATGSYLRDFSKRQGVLSLPLTQNRRSLPGILAVANSLSGTSSKPFRTTASRPSGAYYWRYDEKKLPQLMSTWPAELVAAGYELSEAVILCRGNALLERLTTASSKLGLSTVKHFAAAALEREQNADMSKAVDHCAQAVLNLVRGLPDSLIGDLKGMRGDADMRILRRLVWKLLRSPDSGIPSATREAKTDWLPTLKNNLGGWLNALEAQSSFSRVPTWEARLKSTKLASTGPLLVNDLEQNEWGELRCGTVHSVKGEGIPAVLYLTNKSDLNAMLSGTDGEEGRIGFVAVTRARDLLVIGIPKDTTSDIVDAMHRHGFTEWPPGHLATLVEQQVISAVT